MGSVFKNGHSDAFENRTKTSMGNCIRTMCVCVGRRRVGSRSVEDTEQDKKHYRAHKPLRIECDVFVDFFHLHIILRQWFVVGHRYRIIAISDITQLIDTC